MFLKIIQMKNTNRLILLSVSLLLVSTGCKKSFEDLSTNNNKPSTVPPSLLLTGILNDMYNPSGGENAPNDQNEIRNQYYIYNYDYYGNNRYDFGSGDNYYSTLENVVRMETEAVKAGISALNPYSALGKFFSAYFFTQMSMQTGDIPFTQALQGIANLAHAYDPQKVVFQKSLQLLDSANIDLASLITAGDKNLSGDIYYGN